MLQVRDERRAWRVQSGGRKTVGVLHTVQCIGPEEEDWCAIARGFRAELAEACKKILDAAYLQAQQCRLHS